MSYENYVFEKIKTLEFSIVDDISALLKDDSMKKKILSSKSLSFIYSLIFRYVESFIEKDTKKAKELSIKIYIQVCKRAFLNSGETSPMVFIFISQKVNYNSLKAFYLPKVVVYNFKYLRLIEKNIMKT